MSLRSFGVGGLVCLSLQIRIGIPGWDKLELIVSMISICTELCAC